LEAKKLHTIEDLLRSPEERVELINGEVVRRPMAGSDHALVQSGLSDELAVLKRKNGPGGWWIMPEVAEQGFCHSVSAKRTT
jgi:Uma2 family endonuclease